MASREELDAKIELLEAVLEGIKEVRDQADSLDDEEVEGNCGPADCKDEDDDMETAEEEFFRVLGDLMGAGVSPDKAAELALAFTLWDFNEEY